MLKNRSQFYFVRHGETDFNRAGVFVGKTDVPLNEVGRTQARRAAALLKNYKFSTIVSSPLLRAHETAQIIGAQSGIVPVIVPELQECSFGVMEGKAHTSSYIEYLMEWRGGMTFEEAESYKDFANRVLTGVDRALEFEGPVLVVAHGAIGTVLGHALGLHSIEFDNAVPHSFDPHERHEVGWRVERIFVPVLEELV